MKLVLLALFLSTSSHAAFGGTRSSYSGGFSRSYSSPSYSRPSSSFGGYRASPSVSSFGGFRSSPSPSATITRVPTVIPVYTPTRSIVTTNHIYTSGYNSGNHFWNNWFMYHMLFNNNQAIVNSAGQPIGVQLAPYSWVFPALMCMIFAIIIAAVILL